MVAKSIHKKQFILYAGVLTLSYIMLACILFFVFRQYMIRTKESQLIMQGEKIASQYTQTYLMGPVNIVNVAKELEMMEKYMDTRVFLVDRSGTVLYSTGAENTLKDLDLNNETLKELMNYVMNGQVAKAQGQLGGVFSESHLTISYPIIINKRVIGALFMNTSLPALHEEFESMYSILLISLVGALVLTYLLFYVSSRQITKPLLEMNEIAKIIQHGNFGKRIEVTTEDEIGQLADSFNHMAESLFEQERRKNEFMANIAHDLRSPLTSIQGFLTAMLDGVVPEEQHGHYLQIVLDETKRVTKLANDVFELSKRDFNTEQDLHKTVFDVNEMLRTVLVNIEGKIHEKDLAVSIVLAEDNTYVFADEDKTLRVIYNLLDNAVKFSHGGGKITIETTLEKQKVVIAIADEGIGIGEEEQSRIFDRFYKVDVSRGEDKKGGGLGLAIVKEFLLMQGEDIKVKSKLGKGAKFTFTLALAEQNIPGEEPQQESNA